MALNGHSATCTRVGFVTSKLDGRESSWFLGYRQGERMADGADQASGVMQSGRYAAFISYSHADEDIGNWLHRRLESYQVPAALVGRDGPNGPIKKRLGKVFRDRVDLSAAHDLGAEIRRGLENSSALVVLCSPRSCGSKYVQEEIRLFKQLGKGHRILAAIVDGEPHAAGKPGWSPSDECFPPALIYRLADDGSVSSLPELTEPIAADFRDGKDGRESGALKIVAGLLDVGLDELVQRERQAERGRRRRANLIAAAMAVLATGAVIASMFAWNQRDIARNSLARIFAERSWQAMERGDYPLAARYAVSGWRAAPANTAEYQVALQKILYDSSESFALRGHEGDVFSAVFSIDGKRIVTASEDHTARVWESATGREVAVLRGHQKSVRTAVFSPDGARILTASEDRTARLWDLTGREIIAMRGHEKEVIGAAFSSDGTRIVTTSTDFTARIWDAHSGHEILVVPGAYSAAFSPDGARVAIGIGTDRIAEVWDIASGSKTAVLRGSHGSFGTVPSVAFSPDGKRIVNAAWNGARVWDSESGREVSLLRLRGEGAGEAEFQPRTDSIVLTTSTDFAARTWDVRSGREIAALRGHNGAVHGASFSSYGDRIVTASADRTARVWGAYDGRAIAVLRGHEGDVNSATFSPDGTRIVTASSDRTARVWAAVKGHEMFTMELGGLVQDPTFSPDGARMVATTGEGAVLLWNANYGGEAYEIEAHEGVVLDAAFSPDSTQIVTASNDRTARVWDAGNRRQIAILRGHVGALRSAAFSPDGKRIVTASEDHTARVWEGATGREVAVLRGHAGEVLGAAFGSDGTRVFTTSDDRTFRVWDAESGREVVRSSIPSPALAFDKDGTRVIFSQDNTLRLWDVAMERQIAVLRGHEGAVHSATFSSEGNLIVSTSSDGTARVWDTATGREIALFRSSSHSSAAFSVDTTRIATNEGPGTVRVWNVTHLSQNMAELAAETCATFLLPERRRFSAVEIGADPIIHEVWLRDHREDRDICEGIAPPIGRSLK
jgi:WD40 repeat protein